MPVQVAQCADVQSDLGSTTVKTYPILTKDGGRPYAFEIENVYISPRTAARLLAQVSGVSNVELRRMFSKSCDVHVGFSYLGQSYMVWEPFGDNSRYWIGPTAPENDTGAIEALEAAFKTYQPPIHRVLLGDVLTFRIFTRLFRGQESNS